MKIDIASQKVSREVSNLLCNALLKLCLDNDLWEQLEPILKTFKIEYTVEE